MYNIKGKIPSICNFCFKKFPKIAEPDFSGKVNKKYSKESFHPCFNPNHKIKQSIISIHCRSVAYHKTCHTAH